MHRQHVGRAAVVDSDEIVAATLRERDEILVNEDDRNARLLEHLGDAPIDHLVVTAELQRSEEDARHFLRDLLLAQLARAGFDRLCPSGDLPHSRTW